MYQNNRYRYQTDTYARFISSFICINYLLLHKTFFLRNSVLIIIILMLSIVLLSYNSTFQTVVVAKKHHISIIGSSDNGRQLPPHQPPLIQIFCAGGAKLQVEI